MSSFCDNFTLFDIKRSFGISNYKPRVCVSQDSYYNPYHRHHMMNIISGMVPNCPGWKLKLPFFSLSNVTIITVFGMIIIIKFSSHRSQMPGYAANAQLGIWKIPPFPPLLVFLTPLAEIIINIQIILMILFVIPRPPSRVKKVGISGLHWEVLYRMQGIHWIARVPKISLRWKI